jgi:hypothetical protein
MVRLAATYHIGLSTEVGRPLNNDLCLSNKVFSYLLAGVPQLLSRTSGQSQFAPELGEAAILADLNAPEEAAARLDDLLASPAQFAAARAKAWRLGQDRFCWDIEQTRFLDGVSAAIRADGKSSCASS